MRMLFLTELREIDRDFVGVNEMECYSDDKWLRIIFPPAAFE